MPVEHRIVTAAPPAVVYALYQDVEHWHEWDPDTKRAFISGPFAVGSRGRLTPAKGNTVPMVLTQVEPDRGFTVESKIPLFRMVFEHVLTPVPAGTEILHRVSFSGLLTPLLGRMLTRQLNQGLPVTLGRLKALAESRARAPQAA
jgi:hypothetical protein